MSEVVLKECPVCGTVFEDDSTRHNRKVCSASCAARRSHASRAANLKGALRVELEAKEAAKRRRDRILKRRDAEFAKIGVRVVITKGEGGGHIERRGTVGGGCCAVNSAAFNPRPFDLRIFKP